MAILSGYAPLVLTAAQRDLLLRLPPAAFSDDRATLAVTLAQEYTWRGNTTAARPYWAQAREELTRQLAEAPDSAPLHASAGLALAHLGRKDEALREGERAVSLAPVDKDAFYGPDMLVNLTRIHLVLGNEEAALDLLQRSLEGIGPLTKAWARIDPDLKHLLGNPRFERLTKG